MLFRLIILITLLMPGIAKAECPLAEQAEKNGKYNIAYMQYIYCAEEENDVDAQFKLGTMFYQGLGLSKPDFRRAVAFFARAADNGYAPAQVKLGLLYWRGEGIEKNLLKAHKWLYLAQEPAEMRWFYYVGSSSDPSAGTIYSKINGALKPTDKDIAEEIPFLNMIPPSAFGTKFIPSYREVAEFQHEKLIEAGEELMDERSQSDLKTFLNNLKPDINPKFPADMPEEKKQSTLQMILDWFKPVMLTQDNLTPSKIPVLEKLKNEIDGVTPE
ncbi:MAG: sel1 repeat family protein [Alphaproteobacteria bacterium]|nr:sel1 repeat family protein [Alphaproteobacteria bacterium]